MSAAPSPAPEQPARARSAKTAVITVLAVLSALVVGSQFVQMFTSRPKVVTEPTRTSFERFGIDRASDPRLAAPPIELRGLDGARVSLADARGQVVFVNFWATWCPPCREEMPSMIALGQDLASRYPGQFKMIAVTVDDDLAAVRSYFASPPFLGPPSSIAIAHDADQTVTRSYYAQARGFVPDIKFPETYIVDKSGRLIAYVVGPRDWSDPAARAFLEALIRS
jgi:thiol-disulfide isomerase/thioredoxin